MRRRPSCCCHIQAASLWAEQSCVWWWRVFLLLPVRQRVLARANHDIIVDNQTIQLSLTPGSVSILKTTLQRRKLQTSSVIYLFSNEMIVRGVARLLVPFYRRVFHSVGLWEKVVSASHDDVTSRLGHDTNRLQTRRSLWGLDPDDEAPLKRKSRWSQLH